MAGPIRKTIFTSLVNPLATFIGSLEKEARETSDSGSASTLARVRANVVESTEIPNDDSRFMWVGSPEDLEVLATCSDLLLATLPDSNSYLALMARAFAQSCRQKVKAMAQIQALVEDGSWSPGLVSMLEAIGAAARRASAAEK